MKFPRRFSLTTMLLATSVLGAVLGYIEWRKQWIIAEVNSLNDEQCINLHLREGRLWPYVEGERVVLEVAYSERYGLLLGFKQYSQAEIEFKLESLTKRLRKVGVSYVRWTFYYLDETRVRGEVFTGDTTYVPRFMRRRRESRSSSASAQSNSAISP